MTTLPAASEHSLQIGCADYLRHLIDMRKLPLAFHHPANGEHRDKRTAAKLKAYGVTAGQPDFEIFLPEGRTIFVELKAIKGVASPTQKARHDKLIGLGFKVYIIRARTVYEATEQLIKILKENGVQA